MIAQAQINRSNFSPLSPKFIRRNDLTLEVRIAITLQAYEAQIKGNHGTISWLSKQYKISRTFIYDSLSLFKSEMENLFFPNEQTEKISKKSCEATILAQRFEGKSSIEAISTLMKRANLPFSSVGSISQILSHIGQSLPNTLKNTKGTEQLVIFASDEVFAKSIPLLITVEPISSTILKIERADQRTAAIWSTHFQSIQDNGFQAKLLASDAGTGLTAAHKETLADVPWQLDTFHGIAHRLGDWVRRLEKSAYTAIESSAKQEDKLISAKSDTVIDKRLNLCLSADKMAEQAIDLSTDFNYLYQIIIHELNTFDSNGHLRQRDKAEKTIEIALELIESLNHKRINKEVASVRKALPDLLTYFDDALVAVKNCQSLALDPDVLQTLFLAWQWNKTVIKSKVSFRKNRAIEERQFYLELAQLFIGDQEKYLELKASVYAELETIVQASSLVECINSILRPYLNHSKNQVTQEFLNTFMFYHNHRRYHAGKRKGQTPMEILTGIEQKEDWITLLLREVKEKESVFVA